MLGDAVHQVGQVVNAALAAKVRQASGIGAVGGAEACLAEGADRRNVAHWELALGASTLGKRSGVRSAGEVCGAKSK